MAQDSQDSQYSHRVSIVSLLIRSISLISCFEHLSIFEPSATTYNERQAVLSQHLGDYSLSQSAMSPGPNTLTVSPVPGRCSWLTPSNGHGMLNV